VNTNLRGVQNCGGGGKHRQRSWGRAYQDQYISFTRVLIPVIQYGVKIKRKSVKGKKPVEDGVGSRTEGNPFPPERDHNGGLSPGGKKKLVCVQIGTKGLSCDGAPELARGAKKRYRRG